MNRIIAAVLVSAVLLGGGCAGRKDFDARLEPLVKPHRFSIAGWELKTLTGQAGQWLSASLPFGLFDDDARAEVRDEAAVVKDYFANATRIRLLQSEIEASGGQDAAQRENELRELEEEQRASAAAVERILKGQIRKALAEEGIFNPVTHRTVSFPPLNFRLEEMPDLLVISPRDRIEPLKEIVLHRDMTLEERESLEAGVDGMNVSSLVLSVGGIATYPSLVDYTGGLAWTLETVAHEWAHQYLAFTPLGFRYILDLAGISKSYDIATMNESLANIVGKEIGEKVYRKYYAPPEGGASRVTTPVSGFNLRMREIRKAVDAYLAEGKIEEAEAFMEEKRLELAATGYRIRKLNQAYFAFNGTYADGPAFLNPIGAELKELREKSASLKDFLATVSRMTNRQGLAESVK